MRIHNGPLFIALMCLASTGCAIETGYYYRVSAPQGKISGDRPGDINSPVAISFDRGPDVGVYVQGIRKDLPRINALTLNISIAAKRPATIQVNWQRLEAVNVQTGEKLKIAFVSAIKTTMTSSGYKNAPLVIDSSFGNDSNTTYYFEFEFPNGVSANFNVTFPRVLVNGVSYPPLVLHYVKTKGFRIMM